MWKLNAAGYRVSGILLVALLSATGSLPAFATEMHQFDVPEEEAALAIRDFGLQAHVQILAAGENVSGKTLHAVSGELSTEQGLSTLLAGSGLTHRYIGDHAVALVPVSNTAPVLAQVQSDGPQQQPEKAGGSFWDRFRLAQAGVEAGGGGAAITSGSTGSSSATPVALEEVVVTAQKREQRLQDVPVPVSVVNAQDLIEQNQLRLEDYYTTIPGLSMAPSDLRGGPILTIRGVTTGSQLNPTVGITVDDVPYGSSTSLGGGFTVPDMDPSDLARVEVLRGPQGTLYGADSLGGLFKYVTIDPSTAQLTGQLQAGLSTVQNGDGAGYSARGNVNVPVTDTVAVRASGYTRRDPGYIDDPLLSAKGVNQVDANGGRLAALWRPTDAVSLKLSAMLQHSTADGLPYVTVGSGLGDLQQSALRGSNGYSKRFQVYSAVLQARLGLAQLTSVTGYSINIIDDSLDLTPALGSFTTPYGAGSVEHNRTEKVSQEVRLSMPLGPRLDWLLGVFYTHEHSQFAADIRAVDPANGQPITSEISEVFPTNFEEYAAFTDFTLHLTDLFEIQVGGRESQNRQTYTETDIGPFVPLFDGGSSQTVVFPEIHSKANSFTYLVTPTFHFSPDAMLYARLASGYRAGGPNAPPGPGVPAQYQPDKTENYELGVKADTWNHRLTFDASAYYIRWKDIQVLEFLPISGLGYIANAGRAKSQGLELQVDARPLPGLKISAWTAWNQAVLTEAFPANSLDFGASGDRLPFGSRFSGNFSIDQDWPIGNGLRVNVGGLISYIGERLGVFTASPDRQHFPAFARTDLHAGLHWTSWSLVVYGNNIADRRGLLSGGLGTTDPNTFTFIQPRTVGFSVIKRFE